MSPGGLATLPDGSTILSGSHTASISFGSTDLPLSPGNAGLFVARITSSGSWDWSSGATAEHRLYGYYRNVLVAADGSITIAGEMQGDATFGSAGTLVSAGDADIFVARLSSSGVWQWVTRAGGAGRDYAASTALLPDGSVAVGGEFASSPADFGDITLNSVGDYFSGFVGRVSNAGEWDWALEVVPDDVSGYAWIQTIGVTGSGNISFSGTWSNANITFDGLQFSDLPLYGGGVEHGFTGVVTPSGNLIPVSPSGLPTSVTITAEDSEGSIASTSVTLTTS